MHWLPITGLVNTIQYLQTYTKINNIILQQLMRKYTRGNETKTVLIHAHFRSWKKNTDSNSKNPLIMAPARNIQKYTRCYQIHTELNCKYDSNPRLLHRPDRLIWPSDLPNKARWVAPPTRKQWKLTDFGNFDTFVNILNHWTSILYFKGLLPYKQNNAPGWLPLNCR